MKKPKRTRVSANPAFRDAMQELRRSNAATAIPARKQRRQTTRSSVRAAAVREW